MMLMGKAGILLNRISIISAIALFSAICFAIYKIIKFYTISRPQDNVELKTSNDNAFSFSKNQIILIILLLFLTIFIKTSFLKNSVFPTATDLGHHMYWSKTISETGELPVYQERDIVQINGNYRVSQPENIADFIIGEHLIFSAINLISGINFVSYFPSIILFLIHIAGILAIFILTLRLFKDYSFGKNAAIFSLFLMGPIYAISSSQAKFVSGGVIGNTIGNLLIPMAIYFLLRTLKEKNSIFLSLSLLSILGLAYTHHLSTFVFIFIFLFTIAIFVLLNIKNIFSHLKDWMKIIFKPQIIILLVISCLFVFAIYTPAYFNTKAVGTAVGGPSKETRAGLTFNQLKTTAGEARMVLGLIGIAILLAIKKRGGHENAFVLGWAISILAMSLWPQMLFLDLPSNRIANYISFPLVISGAFALAYFIDKLHPHTNNDIILPSTNNKNIGVGVKNSKGNYCIKPKAFYALCFMLCAFMLTSGFYDNSQSINISSNYPRAMQTFSASQYLSERVSSKDSVVKDHNYLVADTWMKIYFTRDYNFPFSRGYFKRYEDATKPREMCTLWMIGAPNTSEGQKCFNDLGINFTVVNPQFDSAQFQKSQEFWQVYSGNEINIYYRKF